MKETNYLLRRATEADYEYCYELTKQNMIELFSRHWGGWQPSAFRRDFRREDTTIVAIAEHDVGFFSLKEIDTGLYLENIQLSPSVQGQGIGTAILKSLLQNNPSKLIQLTTFTDNPATTRRSRDRAAGSDF